MSDHVTGPDAAWLGLDPGTQSEFERQAWVQPGVAAHARGRAAQ
jgi:hypothetical protein